MIYAFDIYIHILRLMNNGHYHIGESLVIPFLQKSIREEYKTECHVRI